jgi:formamidopyrimidine-DNA glycosylase
MRQFGFAALANEDEVRQVLARYGIEPLSREFTWQALVEILRERKATIKSVLLNQSLIAGLGNIYADEACFLAGVRPSRPANSLTEPEIKKLHRGIRRVLELSLKHRGTTFNDYRDAAGRRGEFMRRLKVYGRAGKSCRRCRRGVIRKVKSGQRGTAFCPECQI